MAILSLEEGENYHFAREDIKKRIGELFRKKYSSIKDFTNTLYQNPDGLPQTVYVPKKFEVEMDELPLFINEWPVYGPLVNGLSDIIAKLVVVNDESSKGL